MAAVEIDEVELLRLRKQDSTVHALLANPKSKRKIFEAYKEHDPNARIPELEIEEAARAPVTALETKVAELQKKIEDDAAERAKNAKLHSLSSTIDEGKAKLRRAGWTDEGLEALDKVMEEKGTTDIEMAAAYYEKLHPPQSPVAPRGHGGWNFMQEVQDGEADLKRLLDTRGDNEIAVDKMAREALNDYRGASRR